MKTVACFFTVLALICLNTDLLLAQMPEFEQHIDITAAWGSGRIVADGYGQHEIRVISGAIVHRLLGNDGLIISSHSSTINFPDYYTILHYGFAASTHAGKLYVVALSADRTKLRARVSADGGATWSALPDYPLPLGTVLSYPMLNSLSDNYGTHVVWSNFYVTGISTDKVHYVRYSSQAPGWTGYKHVTDLESPTSSSGYKAVVTTIGLQGTVSYMNQNGTHPRNLASRDLLDIPSDNWATEYQETNNNYSYTSLDMASSGSTIRAGLTVYSSGVGGGVPRQLAVKVGGGSWSVGGFANGSSVAVAVSQGTFYALSDRIVDLVVADNHNMELTQLPPGPSWLLHNKTVYPASYGFPFQALVSSQTGLYSFWANDTFYDGTVHTFYYVQRKVISLSGSISYNTFLTGNNWVTDDLTIQAGVQVNLKPGSVTYVSDNKRIIVQNGASLVAEPGSQLVFGPGAKYQLNPSVVNTWNLTGIPVVVPDFHATTVYPTATSQVFGFNGEDYVPWSILVNDRGWFVKFGGNQIIPYEGDFIPYQAMVANPGNKWSIIGSISSPIATSNVSSSPPGIIVSPFYKYSVQNGYQPADTLKPGAGYWVHTSAGGQIILDINSSIASQAPLLLDTYDKFVLTDAADSKQELYVRNAQLVGATGGIEMPPAPPDAPFDVRFSSGDFVKTVVPDSGETTVSIAVNQARHPVQLTWQIRPENGISYSILTDSSNRLGRSAMPARISGSESMVIPNRSNGLVTLSVSARGNQQQAGIPIEFSLRQNFPNPFNPSTTIQYSIAKDAQVSLLVYDVLGRQVAELASGFKRRGSYTVHFDASHLSSGIYVYRLQTPGFTLVKKMLVVK